MISEDREHFKAKLKDIAMSFYKFSNENYKYENNLSSEELSSLKTLIRSNIVILKVDKGNTIVLIGKDMHAIFQLYRPYTTRVF